MVKCNKDGYKQGSIWYILCIGNSPKLRRIVSVFKFHLQLQRYWGAMENILWDHLRSSGKSTYLPCDIKWPWPYRHGLDLGGWTWWYFLPHGDGDDVTGDALSDAIYSCDPEVVGECGVKVGDGGGQTINLLVSDGGCWPGRWKYPIITMSFNHGCLLSQFHQLV